MKFEPLNVPEFIMHSFAQRLHEHGPGGIAKALKNVSESDFLRKTRKYVTTFQWFLEVKNFQNAIDGRYNTLFDDGDLNLSQSGGHCKITRPGTRGRHIVPPPPNLKIKEDDIDKIRF